MKGSFTYQDMQEMSLPEFFEWQKVAMDAQVEENKQQEKDIKKAIKQRDNQQSNRRR